MEQETEKQKQEQEDMHALNDKLTECLKMAEAQTRAATREMEATRKENEELRHQLDKANRRTEIVMEIADTRTRELTQAEERLRDAEKKVRKREQRCKGTEQRLTAIERENKRLREQVEKENGTSATRIMMRHNHSNTMKKHTDEVEDDVEQDVNSGDFAS